MKNPVIQSSTNQFLRVSTEKPRLKIDHGQNHLSPERIKKSEEYDSQSEIDCYSDDEKQQDSSAKSSVDSAQESEFINSELA